MILARNVFSKVILAAVVAASAQLNAAQVFNPAIQEALEHLYTAGEKVEYVIEKISGGGGPVSPMESRSSVNVDESSDETDENDWAANRALLGIQSQLVQTAQDMEDVLASGQICDPCVKQQLCRDISNLRSKVKAGRIAAQLPMQGVATPFDFDDIGGEIMEAHRSLNCQ